MPFRFLLCASLMILGILVAGCRRGSAPVPTMEDVRAAAAPTQESWDVEYIVTQTPSGDVDSRPRMNIRADYMATFETEDSTYTVMASDSLDRVRAVLFDEAGDTSAVIRADRIIMYEDENRFEARGNVVVDTPEEKKLESEHLLWLEDEREIQTPGFVRITTPGEHVQGYSLVADENLDTYTLSRITGQVTVEEDE